VAFATIAHLPDGAESFTTIELKCNFLGTATEAWSRQWPAARTSAARRSLGCDGDRGGRRQDAGAVSLHADDPVAEALTVQASR